MAARQPFVFANLQKNTHITKRISNMGNFSAIKSMVFMSCLSVGRCLFQMFLYPFHVSVFCGIRCPMLIDRSDERLFLAFQHIVHSIGCGRRAGVVVVSPCHISRASDVACKVHDIIVSHDFDFFRCQHSFRFFEMRITACASLFRISCHIG